jgi:copper homeostasis protein
MKCSKINLEVCVDNAANALIAQEAGAMRVELCSNLLESGVTPSPAQISTAREHLQISLYVLIRPRGGDFLYSNTEFDIIKSDIHYCGKAGCDGVVIGMLCSDGSVDKKRNRILIDIARQYGMGVTFHRAFDRCTDLMQSLEDIIKLGCERILTSGGYNTAIRGIFAIRNLVNAANGRISIMAGGGITPENVNALIKKTGITELHGTFRSLYIGKMQYINKNLANLQNEYGMMLPDAKKIKTIVNNIALYE